MRIAQVVNGILFETRRLPAKGTYDGRVYYYINGQRVPMETYSAERMDAWFAQQDASPMFRDHACWKCQDGAKPCVQGNPRQCAYPVANNH